MDMQRNTQHVHVETLAGGVYIEPDVYIIGSRFYQLSQDPSAKGWAHWITFADTDNLTFCSDSH